MADLAGIDLSELVNEMTTAMLGCEAVESKDDDAPVQDREVIGCVHLTGEDWSGSILVAMPEETARSSTATLFFSEPDAVTEDEVADAVGEFANVLAGSAKTAIGGGCALSLPSVTSGAGLRVVVPGTVTVETKRYITDLGTITVSALARQTGGTS
jgi:chemotaxis protein CheX